MKKPIQCFLWKKDKLTSDDLNYQNFEHLETFEEDSHYSTRLVKCKECGQRYFKQFYEEINWAGGNDAQYFTLIPVETNDEIETLKNAGLLGALSFFPRLQDDHPMNAKEPKIYWIGK